MQVWILRHARAENDSKTGRDRDRPLSSAGRQAALNLNRWLKASAFKLPTQALVSPALRTRQTAEIALDGLPVNLVLDDQLWMAPCPDLLKLIDQGRRGSDLFLVGHNPGLEALVHQLGCSLPVPGLKPGTLVLIDLDAAGQDRLIDVVPPNEAT